MKINVRLMWCGGCSDHVFELPDGSSPTEIVRAAKKHTKTTGAGKTKWLSTTEAEHWVGGKATGCVLEIKVEGVPIQRDAKPAMFSLRSTAERLLGRYQRTYPNKEYKVLPHTVDVPQPNGSVIGKQMWTVCQVLDNGFRTKAMPRPTRRMQGEPIKFYKYNVEYTDTFCGEANYSWVQRHVLKVPEHVGDAQIMKLAKAAVGLRGAKGQSFWHGDDGEFRPRGLCTVMFVTFDYT